MSNKTTLSLIGIILWLFTQPLFAHSKLINSEPADKAELTQAPSTLTLNFNRKVRLMKLKLVDHSETVVELEFKPSPAKQKKHTIDLPTGLSALKPETYQVQWVAMSRDTHKISGELSFTIKTEPSSVHSDKPDHTD